MQFVSYSKILELCHIFTILFCIVRSYAFFSVFTPGLPSLNGVLLGVNRSTMLMSMVSVVPNKLIQYVSKIVSHSIQLCLLYLGGPKVAL